jgi:hypothetical protein
MKGYSINGFLNTVLRRSGRTILVEGVTDQSLLTRLKLEIDIDSGRTPSGNVDPVCMISDDDLFGLGNKEKIARILGRISESPELQNALTEKLGSLIDREWDGLVVDLQIEGDWTEPAQISPHFTTVGHSVENYFFRSSAFESYLRAFHAENISARYTLDFHNNFNAAVGLANAYSLVLRKYGLITRGDGLISRQFIVWNGSRYGINSEITSAYAGRKVEFPAELVTMVNDNVELYFGRHPAVEPGRWLCHGHLGEQIIWACAAHLAEHHGMPREICEKIERGSKDVKFKFFSDYVTRESLDSSAPLRTAVEWLCAAQ